MGELACRLKIDRTGGVGPDCQRRRWRGISAEVSVCKSGPVESFNLFFFFQAEDGIRDDLVTGVQTCALPILCLRERAGKLRVNPAQFPEAAAIHSLVSRDTFCARDCQSVSSRSAACADQRYQIGRASCRERV